jgi:hypothetical protein
LDYLTTHTSLSPILRGFAPSFVNYKKGALDSQPQVIKFTSCLPMICGSLRVLRLLPPLNWSPWYSWNIAESGDKYQEIRSNQSTIFQLYCGVSVLLVEEIGGPGENHRPAGSHWQTVSHNVVHLALIEIRTHNISSDRNWLRRYYHTTTAYSRLNIYITALTKVFILRLTSCVKIFLQLSNAWPGVHPLLLYTMILASICSSLITKVLLPQA